MKHYTDQEFIDAFESPNIQQWVTFCAYYEINHRQAQQEIRRLYTSSLSDKEQSNESPNDHR